MKFQNHICIFLLIQLSFPGNGQELLFNNISNQLNLPSQESYNVMQDSKGYIWISTEAGLCKYNGTNIKVFDKKNGLPENACYAVKEDNKGAVWILTSANRVLRCEKDSLMEAPFSRDFASQLHNNLAQAYSISFFRDSILINTQNESYLCNTNSTSTRKLSCDSNYGYSFIKNNAELLNVKDRISALNLMKQANTGVLRIEIFSGKETKQIILNYKSKDQPTWRVLTASNKKGESFIAISNLLIKLNADNSYSVYDFPQDILSLYCDGENGLWVGANKGGVHYFSDTQFMTSEMMNLEGFSVSDVCVDAENGVWCTTLEKGVFYCRNKNVTSYATISGLDKPADLLKFEGGKIFSSTGNNEIVELHDKNFAFHKLNLMGNKTISDIVKDERGWSIVGKSIFSKTNESFSDPVFVQNKFIGFYAGANELDYAGDHRLFDINYGGVSEIVSNMTIRRKYPLESGGRCLKYIGNNILLYGCKDGLYKMLIEPVGNERQYATKKINGLDGTVTCILKSSKNEIWITTKENGLYKLKSDSVIFMSRILKLPSDRLYGITEDVYGTIWIGSNVGLIRLKQKNGNSEINVYNTLHGLPSKDIYKIAADSNFIYLSTTEGICRFPLNAELNNTTQPSIFINNLKVNDMFCSTESNLHFPYYNNSLKIEFDLLTFKQINAPTLMYTLIGLNQKTYKSDTLLGNVISLDNAAPDEYVLSVFAVNNDGIRSKNPVLLRFEILKPYWQNGWFIFSWILGIALMLYCSVFLIVKRIRKKEEEKTRINKQLTEFQLTALQAQMNPHFIFNAINSIQNYILKKKEQEAYNYLAKFSKLIRMVLNNSEQKTLSLHDELATINLYVELEQLRFKKNFEYKLGIDPAIDVHDVQVPTMLIQPYIENAIWHGLMNLEDDKNGVIILRMTIQDSLLKIIIEDNGIGRNQSIKYRKESVHRPIAMKLTEKRLFMINAMEDYVGAKVLITDLYDETGKATGTRVEIYLPMF